MAAVSNVIPFGLLFMRPLQWCLKTKGVLPEGKPALHDQGHAAMPMCLGHVEETLVLFSGPSAGSSMLPRMLATDVSLTGWGVVMSGHPARGLWSGHHPVWHFSCLEMLAAFQGRRGPPHSSVPVSPLCPREISLPTLPVPQGAAVSSEPTPQSSARKRSGAGELATPAGVSTAASSAVSCRSSDLRTVERGYRIQFGAPPPPFNGVSTVVSPEQGLAMEQEVEILLRKEAIEVVPPHDRESWFYSRYFVVPKKDGGLRPLFRSETTMRLKFKMLTFNQVVSQIRSEDWFVTVDLKDAYFHVSILPQHRKFLRFACSTLHSPPAFERAGVETERQEECAVSITENHLSRRGVGFDHDAGTFVTCSDRVYPHCSHESERKPVTHCKAVPATAGSDGSCVQRDTFWPAVHETPTVVAQDQGVSPRGHPFCMIKGPVLGAPCRRITLATDASLTGWGAVMSSHPARGLWSSHHLTWHINCLEMLAVFRALKHFLPDLICHHVLVRTDNTAVVYYIYHQGGLRSCPLYKLAHQILVWSQDRLLSLRAVHVPGYLNMGADIPSRQGLRPGEWMLHPEVVKQIWRFFGQAQLYLFVARRMRNFWRECAGVLEVVGAAPEGAHLIDSGLSTEVVETILQCRAPSSRKLYALKWKPFTSWCGDRQQDSVNCPVGTVLGFLQDRFSTGLAHSTLKVYVATILAYHAPLGGSSVGRNPLVTRFLRGALRPRPLASACFSIQKLLAACTARAFKLPGLYVTLLVTSRFSIGLFAHVFQSVVTLEAFP
ncbi:enzymatic polyprotein [Labeo rohita]|uniref:Enzymatic polyprotein n=1 Tax=Labeo rohita TaxID=84645 RepID=A0ABQ8LY35_LABRO|nr:enzymatic polyprotein [Labeo rohita]